MPGCRALDASSSRPCLAPAFVHSENKRSQKKPLKRFTHTQTRARTCLLLIPLAYVVQNHLHAEGCCSNNNRRHDQHQPGEPRPFEQDFVWMQWTTWSELHTLHTRMCGGEGVDGGAAFGVCDLPYGQPCQPHTMTKRFVAQMCKFLAKCHPKKAYHLLTTAPRHRPIHPLLHSVCGTSNQPHYCIHRKTLPSRRSRRRGSGCTPFRAVPPRCVNVWSGERRRNAKSRSEGTDKSSVSTKTGNLGKNNCKTDRRRLRRLRPRRSTRNGTQKHSLHRRRPQMLSRDWRDLTVTIWGRRGIGTEEGNLRVRESAGVRPKPCRAGRARQGISFHSKVIK